MHNSNLDGLPVLVSGASGAIGSAVCRALRDQGALVSGIDLAPPAEGDKDLFHRYSLSDIRDEAYLGRAIEEVEAVVHLAAWVHRHPKSSDDRVVLDAINVGATRTICGLCEKKTKPVLLASTVAVYGETAQGELDECSVVSPDTDYAKSKLEAERIVLSSGGMVLRLPMVYGAGDRGNTARMISAIQRGWFVVPGPGNAQRDFVGRWNVARAVVCALSSGHAIGKIYLVTDVERTTVGEFADQIADLSRSRRPRRFPLPAVRMAAMAGSVVGNVIGHELPFNSSAFRKLIRDLMFNCSRIQKECGYSPVKSLREGLEEEIVWYCGERNRKCP